jgi:putative redox protein
MAEVVVKNNNEYKQEIKAGSHSFLADVPKADGGTELGPSPHELMLAALGACTSMTIKMYANRKSWPVTAVEVLLREEKITDPDNESRTIPKITREVKLGGDLTDEQVESLKAIADKCPIHKMLSGANKIETAVARI